MFPNYQNYVDLLARRNQGIGLIVISTLSILCWLFVARFRWPKLLPVFERWGVALFYISFGLFAAWSLMR